jgi:Tfp pilus assembly protein PilO
MAGINIDLKKLQNIKLTKEQQQYVALAVVSIAAAVYGYWNFLLKPLGVQQEFWAKAVKERTENLKKAKDFKKNWAEFETRLARVQAGEDYVSRRILPATGADRLMLRISKLALESGVGLTSYRPEDTTTSQMVDEGIYKNLGRLEISCTYHQLGAFFSKLSGEDVIYNVEEMEVVTSGLNFEGTGMSLKGTLKFVSYSLPPGGAK